MFKFCWPNEEIKMKRTWSISINRSNEWNWIEEMEKSKNSLHLNWRTKENKKWSKRNETKRRKRERKSEEEKWLVNEQRAIWEPICPIRSYSFCKVFAYCVDVRFRFLSAYWFHVYSQLHARKACTSYVHHVQMKRFSVTVCANVPVLSLCFISSFTVLFLAAIRERWTKTRTKNNAHNCVCM